MTSFTDISKWWKSVENDREPGRLTLVLCSNQKGGTEMIPEKWKSWTVRQAEAQRTFNQWNEQWNEGEIVILDTETTGLWNAEIVDIAVIDKSGPLLNTLFFVVPKQNVCSIEGPKST